jgi:anti-sigma B factor antagonist
MSPPARKPARPGCLLDIQVHWASQDVTVILSGELDLASAPALTARLAELVAKHPQRLVLDLAQVVFMDCAGLTPVATARRALPADRPLILRSPARAVRQLLKITQMDQLCVIQDDGLAV